MTMYSKTRALTAVLTLAVLVLTGMPAVLKD
jgi:hypothetical protein